MLTSKETFKPDKMSIFKEIIWTEKMLIFKKMIYKDKISEFKLKPPEEKMWISEKMI